MSDDNYIDVAAISDVPEKGFIVREVGETQIVLANYQDGIFAVENLCSHAFARFDHGRLRGYRLMCPLHGACFDIRNGVPMGPPAMKKIRSFPVSIEGDRVLVQVDD